MKIFFILSCVAVSWIQVKSQTLRETELWIADKIVNYQFSIKDKRDSKVSWTEITATVDFSNSGYLFISETRYFKSKNQPTLHWSHIVPIKHMKSIIYTIEKNYVAVEFGIKTDNVAGQNMILEEIYSDHGLSSESSTVERFTLILGKSFLEDKLPTEFKKAINHLIELHGGEVVK